MMQLIFVFKINHNRMQNELKTVPMEPLHLLLHQK